MVATKSKKEKTKSKADNQSAEAKALLKKLEDKKKATNGEDCVFC